MPGVGTVREGICVVGPLDPEGAVIFGKELVGVGCEGGGLEPVGVR